MNFGYKELVKLAMEKNLGATTSIIVLVASKTFQSSELFGCGE